MFVITVNNLTQRLVMQTASLEPQGYMATQTVFVGTPGLQQFMFTVVHQWQQEPEPPDPYFYEQICPTEPT